MSVTAPPRAGTWRCCRWPESSAASGTRIRLTAMLRWAVEHGCPWNKVLCAIASDGNPEMLAWVQAQP